MSLGLWIDSLTDEQRDRIVEGKEWVTRYYRGRGGGRCLVGHACDYTGRALHDRRSEMFRVDASIANVPQSFDALVARFGLGRIVRACKLRAGANLPTGPGTDRGTPAKRVAASEVGGLPGVVVAVGDVG